MIVLAVIGLVATVGYAGVARVTKSALRQDVIQVAATLRSGYQMAAHKATHHRVLIDLDAQRFRIEECEGDFRLRPSRRETVPEPEELDQGSLAVAAQNRLPPSLLESMDPAKARQMIAAATGKQIGVAICKPPTLPSGDVDGRGHERAIRTDRGIKIRRVFVDHLQEPALDGPVTINFFPLGYGEKAIVEVANQDGDQYSLLLHGMSGRIEFRDGEIRDPDDHMMRDATGDKVPQR